MVIKIFTDPRTATAVCFSLCKYVHLRKGIRKNQQRKYCTVGAARFGTIYQFLPAKLFRIQHIT